jgi:hypothetical protein
MFLAVAALALFLVLSIGMVARLCFPRGGGETLLADPPSGRPEDS